MEDVHIDPSLLSRDVPMSRADVEPATGEEQDAEMADLFGNDEDVDESPMFQRHDETQPSTESEPLSTEEIERRRALEYTEDDIPPEVAVEVREAEVAFPNLPTPKSSDGQSWVIRLPSYMTVDSKPFHPDAYVGPDEEDVSKENLHEQSMTIKLKVENTLRWRWTKDQAGNDVRQSNSRVIRWSDGSLSLRLGKELYDISQKVDNTGGISRQSFGKTQSAPSAPVAHAPGGKTQGLTYLVAQHKRSQVLQAEAAIAGTMTLRPMNMQSEAHKMLVRSVGQKHRKVARLRMTAEPTLDPERELAELKKQSEKRDRKRVKELRTSLPRTPRAKRAHREDAFDSASEAGDEPDGYEDSDEDSPSARRRSTRKTQQPETDYHQDDFVVGDDDDERPQKNRIGDEADDDDDDLDRLDRQIEAQSRRKQQHQQQPTRSGTDGVDAESDDAQDQGMDIESEEDDVQVPRPRPSARKVTIEEEDDDN